MRNLIRAITIVATMTIGVAAQADETSLTASVWLPPSHPVTKYGYSNWLENVERESGGSLTTKLFTGSALLSPADHLSGIRDGIAKVGWIAGTYNPSDIPEDNTIFQMSFVYTDYFVGSFAVTEFNMLDGQMQEQWKRNNLVYLSGFSTPPYRLICTSEIVSVEDMKGKKIRSTGGVVPNWVKSVGGVPVNVSSSESYTGLEKGQIDCATNAIDDLRSRSYWDVAKSVTLVELGAYWSINAGNRDFWHELDTAQRQVILDTMAENLVDTGIGYLNDVEEIVQTAKEMGVKFYEPKQDLLDTLETSKQGVVPYAIELGTEKFGVANAEDMVARFSKIAKKWQDLLQNVDRNDREAMLSLVKQEIYGRLDPAKYSME